MKIQDAIKKARRHAHILDIPVPVYVIERTRIIWRVFVELDYDISYYRDDKHIGARILTICPDGTIVQ